MYTEDSILGKLTSKKQQVVFSEIKPHVGLERTQQLRPLAAIPEDLGSIPSTHMTANNHVYL